MQQDAMQYICQRCGSCLHAPALCLDMHVAQITAAPSLRTRHSKSYDARDRPSTAAKLRRNHSNLLSLGDPRAQSLATPDLALHDGSALNVRTGEDTKCTRHTEQSSTSLPPKPLITKTQGTYCISGHRDDGSVLRNPQTGSAPPVPMHNPSP